MRLCTSFLFYSICLAGCIQSVTLKNGKTKVPADNKVFEGLGSSEISQFYNIKTDCIYEAFNKKENILHRLDNHIETGIYSVYRFYPHGRFNIFFIDRDFPLEENSLNPHYSGKRGVCYYYKNDLRYELYAEKNQWGWLGKLTGTLTFKGDTLFVKRDESPNEIKVYIKRELPFAFLDYQAEW
jgi:hypothetical protein